MHAEKVRFLKHQFIPLLKSIPSDTQPRWGKMTLQQMIEHFTDAVRIASGKTPVTEIVTPAENLPKMRAFMMSEKPFRENTVNPQLPETPPPVKHATLQSALNELQEELHYFFTVFEENRLPQTRNALFGDLNFEQNVQLLHKHALHHLRQFGVNT